MTIMFSEFEHILLNYTMHLTQEIIETFMHEP